MSIPPEAFFLAPDFDGTLQQRIRHMVVKAILSGRLKPGDRLPSSRKLADHLGVSRITVTLAYGELLADDYIVARGRSGYFVSQNAPRRTPFEPSAAPGGRAVDWSRMIGQRFSGHILPDKPPDWRSYEYPFIYGQADETLFDHRHWRLCALQTLGRKEVPFVTADFFERDDPELVRFIATHTLPRRGIAARPEEILVTLGAQNALWLTAQVLLNQRRTAAMENPGYPGLRAILNQSRCNLVYTPVGREGLSFEDLPAGVDVVFTTPSHHCPTNVTMPLERRHALLDHAVANGYMVVEDDYEFEIPFTNRPVPALKSLDRDGRVVYIGSFSKSLFPGLRLGYVVAAEPLIRELRALRATVLRHPPGQTQRTVASFLSLGHYDAMVARMSQAFARRRTIMREALKENGLPFTDSDIEGGSSFWLNAPGAVDTRDLAERLRGRGVLIEPGHVFFGQRQPPRNHYRLAYSSIDETRIAAGIRLIADDLRAA